MKTRSVFYGLTATLLGPFLVAWIATFLMQHHYWSPTLTAHGIVYSSQSPLAHQIFPVSSQWTLWILTPSSHSSAFQKWQDLPKFFPKTPFMLVPLDPTTLSVQTQTWLEAQMPEAFHHEGTLLLVDPQGFLAMSFNPQISVQDVLSDLKKILPKSMPPARGSV